MLRCVPVVLPCVLFPLSRQVRHVQGDFYHREHPGVWLIVQQVWTEAPATR